MTDEARQPNAKAEVRSPSPGTCQSIDWYSEGRARIVEVAGIRITVRFVGRRGRIAIEAPAGQYFAIGRAIVAVERPSSVSPSRC